MQDYSGRERGDSMTMAGSQANTQLPELQNMRNANSIQSIQYLEEGDEADG